jgi:hypothetical protein
MFPGLTNLKTPGAPPVNSSGLSGDNQMQGGIATQNLGGNSLTEMMRSLQNWLSTSGTGSYQTGQGVTAAGIPGFGTAGDTTGTALDTTKAASSTLDPAQSYWSKLLSGDTATTNAAMAPTITQAGLNYANANTNINQNTPRGGFAGVVSAGLPQAEAREVNNQLYSLQPTAATNLNTIAQTRNAIGGTQSNIAGIQGQLANWLSSLGVDISKLGLTGLQTANDSLMTGRGQDVGEHNASMSMAGQLASGLESGITSGVTTGMNNNTTKSIWGS